ncbi:MAG: hypothetical protein O7A66_02980 [Alphaproteobacteria bacterium]|nr:hypothetical protein [Alphaproteobacteria bacterium]
MPWLSQIFEQAVIYLYGQNVQTGEWGLGGTGFLFGYPSDLKGPNHIYAVTNWHVAVSGSFSSIRLCSRSGHDFIELEPHDWIYLPRQDDLALVDITDLLDPDRDDVTVLDARMAVDQEYADQAEIGFGDDVFILGMFANSPGDQRNAPVARFGNIARLPSDDALIAQETGAETPCYLIDMRSRTGFSGSPVFVYRTATSDLRPLTDGGPISISGENTMLNLLGVHCGQYPERFEAKRTEATGDPISEGDQLQGPSAMNVVIPAWRIFEVLDHPDLKAMRMEREARRAKQGRDRPELKSIPEPPTKADNPSHKEDFSRLLTSVTTGKPRDDQT